ncbi:MAG TPA: hypothetical protein VGB87_13100 [Vicinamibacteria bacterium]
MRKLSGREKGLLGLLGVVAAAIGLWYLRHSGAAPAVLGRPRAEKALPTISRIDLSRLDGPRGADEAGRRDLFAFGQAPRNQEGENAPPTVIVATPPPAGSGSPGGGPLAESAPPAPSLPPLSLKYIGSVENKAGVKVAVLLTDRREVLTGQAGQVVANRYRIARIGLESVDLEDVGSGQSRRIPLKGN